MLTISRLDGDTPVSYNGVMPIGRDQLGDAASGLWTLLRGDQVSTSLAMCHRAPVDNLAYTRLCLGCCGVPCLLGCISLLASKQPYMTTSPSVGGQA